MIQTLQLKDNDGQKKWSKRYAVYNEYSLQMQILKMV